jgi:hypothetical protein
MKQPASYAAAWRAHWSFDWVDQFPKVNVPLLCTSADTDTYAHLSLHPPSPLKAAIPVSSDQILNQLCQWWQQHHH